MGWLRFVVFAGVFTILSACGGNTLDGTESHLVYVIDERPYVCLKVFGGDVSPPRCINGSSEAEPGDERMPELTNPVAEELASMLGNNVVAPVEMTFDDGELVSFSLPERVTDLSNGEVRIL